MGAGNSYSWSIPNSILKSPNKIRINWIRAFFDDEAYFNDNGRIRAKSVNKKGLIQVEKMLNKFVPCHITPINGSNKDGTYYLSINKKDSPLFFKKIGSLRYNPKDN